jgi:hypothetical protein
LSKLAKKFDADRLLKYVKTLEFCEVLYLLYSLTKIHGSCHLSKFQVIFIKSVVDKLEQIVPLIKKHFCNVLGLLGIKINFRSNENDNQHVAIANCDVQWGEHKSKNPYMYFKVLILI